MAIPGANTGGVAFVERDLNIDSVIEQLISVRDNPGKQVSKSVPYRTNDLSEERGIKISRGTV